MTEPGYIAPAAPGWWVRKDRIGTTETEYTWDTTAVGLKPGIDYYRPPRIANPNVGPMAMRNKFRRKPLSRTNKFVPSFDSVGAGARTSATSWSWSHTIGAQANCVIVVCNFYAASMTTPVVTGTVGSGNLTQLTSLFALTSGGFNSYIVYLTLLNPPTGTQTVTITAAGVSSFTAANSISYCNVGSFGTVATNTGTGTAKSLTVPASSSAPASQQLIIGGFTGYTTDMTGFSQSERWNSPYNPPLALVAGDAPGATSVNFAATTAGADQWGGAGFPLLPI